MSGFPFSLTNFMTDVISSLTGWLRVGAPVICSAHIASPSYKYNTTRVIIVTSHILAVLVGVLYRFYNLFN